MSCPGQSTKYKNSLIFAKFNGQNLLLLSKVSTLANKRLKTILDKTYFLLF